MSKHSSNDIFFSLPGVSSTLAEDSIEPIFDHMFCPRFIEKRHYLRPSLACVLDIFEDYIIFFRGPRTMNFVLVKMI